MAEVPLTGIWNRLSIGLPDVDRDPSCC